MEEDHDDIRDKLQCVLNEMLDRGGQVLDSVYLEMVITHLSGKKGEDFKDVLKAQFLQDWVKRSLALVNTDKQNAQLYAFTLRLLALLMENEWQFLNIMDTDICTTMNHQITSTPALQTASVKLAHVYVLLAMLRYSVGTKWLVHSKSWTYVLTYCLESQTIYVLREAIRFMDSFTFTVAADLNDEVLCKEIIVAYLAPLETAVTVHDSIVQVDSSDLQRTVMPCLKTICSLMVYCIHNKKRSCIPHILCKQTNCKLNLWRLTDRTKDGNFFKHIIGTLVLLSFLIYVDELDNKANVIFNQNQFALHFFNHMKFCLVHGNALALLSIAKLYHKLWTTNSDRLPEEIDLEGNRIKFENQIITLQLTPIMFSIVTSKEMRECEIIDSYIMKLFDISTDHTLRVCYAFRDLLTKNRAIVSEVAVKSIQGILSMKNLHRDRAVYVFQALSYSLKDFACGPDMMDAVEVKPDRLIEMPTFLSAILNGLYEMVKEYRITWKESIESMSLMNFMLLLLNKGTLPTRIAVQALKLTQLSVEHFLAPNLALLVENLQGSGIEHLGPTIKKRLHDTQWEVRDSSLELLTSITKISVVKFPAFQQHILDHDLCEVVVQLAKHDAEAFVRASAINCLSSMIGVKQLWDSSLASFDLMQHLLTSIHTESEGIVRKECCMLISEIYRNHNIPNHHFELIFPTMAHLAVNDLHWETKINALYFWRQVFLRLFRYNGVIDGVFPPVTFSKRDKKIVTLTPKEIELRLNLILGELQTRGALGVLLECLNDACDLQVVQTAHDCTSVIDSFLRKYDYKKDLFSAKTTPTSAPFSDPNLSNLHLGDSMNVDVPTTAIERARFASAAASSKIHTSPSRASTTTNRSNTTGEPMGDSECGAQVDAIIETIVSMNDINLLSDTTITEPTLTSPGASSSPHLDPEFFQRMKAVTPDEYIRKIVQMDLSTLLVRRGAWLEKNESFGSLLDDMMFSLQIGDANNADCY